MHIARENYIQALEDRMNNGITDDCIIKIALDDDLNEALREPAALSAHIRSLVTDAAKRYYILLDEIQFALAHALTLKMRYKETTC